MKKMLVLISSLVCVCTFAAEANLDVVNDSPNAEDASLETQIASLVDKTISQQTGAISNFINQLVNQQEDISTQLINLKLKVDSAVVSFFSNKNLLDSCVSILTDFASGKLDQKTPEKPSEQALLAYVKYIPDHELNENYASYFSNELFSLLKEAFAIPSDALGGIGSEEWLAYFVSGNDRTYDRVEIVNSLQNGNLLNVMFNCIWDDGSQDIYTESHVMNLAYENGHWVIIDFDNRKEELLEYIKTQRKFFRSDEWKTVLNDEEDEWGLTELARKEVAEYFEAYPKDRN